MKKINVLPKEVFNRISAGEVVERPASVVKELFENAVDAGAHDITVMIENGGIDEIYIQDDGHGIAKEELHKVFLPHATSKIERVEDLELISTLGFRGEALASIGSVASVKLTSRTQDSDECMQIRCEGGARPTNGTSPARPGNSFGAENRPARPNGFSADARPARPAGFGSDRPAGFGANRPQNGPARNDKSKGNNRFDRDKGDFSQNAPRETFKAQPIVRGASTNLNPDGTRKDENVINKEVYVENEGSEDAYVRVHIAIPTILDDGDPSFDASKNVLHFNADEGTYANGAWNWAATKEGNDTLADGAMIASGAKWNFYKTSISGISYNVYVVTYEARMEKGNTTPDAMSQVYLDKKVTNEDITRIKDVLDDEWKIYVVAEGAQAEGFADAYEALNTSFGTPGAEGYVAPNFLATAEDDIWVVTP